MWICYVILNFDFRNLERIMEPAERWLIFMDHKSKAKYIIFKLNSLTLLKMKLLNISLKDDRAQYIILQAVLFL